MISAFATAPRLEGDMSGPSLQNSLFEEDYLLRELGQVAHVPEVALTELTANAWDAGAFKVEIQIPSEKDNLLTVTDDGTGMNPEQFKRRWMTLRYDRVRHQGTMVDFPPDRKAGPRRAYGRNGIGRHGLLCFANEYEVETWREGFLSTFVVGTDAGPSPFVLRSENIGQRRNGTGTRLAVRVERNLPDPDDVLAVLATRFAHDPKFVISVNGQTKSFDQLKGKIEEVELALGEGRSAKLIVIDSTQSAHNALHQGIAFWVDRRLVGTPSWTLGNGGAFDGRTRFARRYKVIVDTQGFADDVNEDWTGFKLTAEVRDLFARSAECIRKISDRISSEIVDDSSEDALAVNRVDLQSLGRGAQREVAEFTHSVASAIPTASPEFLAAAAAAIINLHKSKSGAALLHKMSLLQPDDVEGLDRLLEEWSIKDALRVLDEIDSRLGVIETIRRIAGDKATDELHTLHPLILRSRWLFGPEFESEEYRSNSTLKTIARKLFADPDAEFINDRHRPDIVAIAKRVTTIQLTGVEVFDHQDTTLVKLRNVLLLELKKGDFEITRDEMTQADNYVQDIALGIQPRPYISAWVVGHRIDSRVALEKKIGDGESNFGQVRATTYDRLVDTANLRLLRLRDHLAVRYADIPTDKLLSRVFSRPAQAAENFGE